MSIISSIDWRYIALAALALILSALAYQGLFTTSSYDLEHEVENLFFHSTASGPGVTLVVALWFVYRRWYRLLALPRRAAYGLALGLLLPCVAIYAWATYTGAQDLLVPALMLHLMGTGALLWGAPALRILALPTLFLVLAMRIPAALLNQVLWAMQIWTAEYTGFVLRVLGIPTSVTGDQILQPDQNFAIIETCAGLRSCESLTMLAFLMLDMFRRRGLHAALLLVAAPVVAFGVNGLRAVTLILNPHSEIGEIHTMQGIAMLLVGLLILYGIDGVLEKFLPRRARAKRAAASSDARPAKTSLVGPLLVSALIAGALVTLSETLPRWQAPARGSLPLPDNQIPKELDGWTSTALNTDLAYLGIVRFRARVDREYKRGRESVRLFVGVGNLETRNGSPLSPKTAFPGSGWWREDELREVALPLDGPRARLSVVRFGTGNRRELALDWTQGSRGLADEILRYALALDNSAWGRPREGVSVRISTPLGATSPSRLAAAEALLLDFYRSFRPKIDLTGYPPSV